MLAKTGPGRLDKNAGQMGYSPRILNIFTSANAV